MARRIFLSAGHGGIDPGASGNGYIERDIAIEFVHILTSELKALGTPIVVDDDKHGLLETLRWLVGKFLPNDILVDVHFNAAGTPAAKGSEIIVPDGPSDFERKLANDLLQVLVTSGFLNRGVKPESLTARKRLGWMRPNAENILIEMCFITNAFDMDMYQKNKVTIAQKMAQVFDKYSKL